MKYLFLWGFFITPILQAQDVTLHQWSLQSPDKQFFTLEKQFTKPKSQYLISYGRGGDEIKVLPMMEKHWKIFHQQMMTLASEVPTKGNCPHPMRLKFRTDKKKVKEFCLSKISKKQRALLRQLAVGMNNYLYAK